MSKHTRQELQQWQGLPLSVKVAMTKERIRNWINYYGEEGVYISFSGGKDSTVLLHLVREDYPDIPAVFCDTGLEYPEIREFVKTFENVVWLKPKMNFRQVIERWGYPFISKEVAECVSGARKYLTRVLEEENAPTDRQTDRQSRLIATSTRNLSERESIKRADAQSVKNLIGGGYNRKYRKLRGLAEFSKRVETTPKGVETGCGKSNPQLPSSAVDGNPAEGTAVDGNSGEYP